MSKSMFTDFMNDIERYLKSKFTGLPEHEFQELATYITNRVTILTTDLLIERDKDWTQSLKRSGVKAVVNYERGD